MHEEIITSSYYWECFLLCDMLLSVYYKQHFADLIKKYYIVQKLFSNSKVNSIGVIYYNIYSYCLFKSVFT